MCFTPVRSPESNGIAEAFVKTFKRAGERHCSPRTSSIVDFAGRRNRYHAAAGIAKH
jgi:hypothetical protein